MDDLLAEASTWLQEHCERDPLAAAIMRKLCERIENLEVVISDLESELDKVGDDR